VAEYQLVHPENADDRLAEFDLSTAEIHEHVVRAGLDAAELLLSRRDETS